MIKLFKVKVSPIVGEPFFIEMFKKNIGEVLVQCVKQYGQEIKINIVESKTAKLWEI